MPRPRPPIAPLVQTAIKVGQALCPRPSITVRPFDKSDRIDFSCR